MNNWELVSLYECLGTLKDSEQKTSFRTARELQPLDSKAVSAVVIYFWRKEMGKLKTETESQI